MSSLIAVLADSSSQITLAILAGAIVLFVSGWLAPEVTGLLAAGLLIATGVLNQAKPSRDLAVRPWSH